jgi:3-hydroxypropanoate dehydrogenase
MCLFKQWLGVRLPRYFTIPQQSVRLTAVASATWANSIDTAWPRWLGVEQLEGRITEMSRTLNSDGQDLLFRNARTHTVWLNKPVDDALLQQAYDLARIGPTSANMCPMRIVFVKSKEAKEKLKPCLDPGNVDKTISAPATAIIGMDVRFYEQLPKLFPHADAKAWFKDLPENVLEYIALRNSSLQGAYFMLAARSLGLDCGPMSGFNNAKVDAAFFADTTVKSNFLCNLGHGDATKLHPRNPRLTFGEACKVL